MNLMGVDLKMTTTLFNILKSELQNKGFNEFVDPDGNLVLFDPEHQFMNKILKYDEDVAEIVDHLFNGASLNQREYDTHFKKSFVFRFLNRKINRQTVESFKVELMVTFMMKQGLINSVYNDLEKYITQEQINESTNKQSNEQMNQGESTTDNRQAYAQLPQDHVNLDVDDTIMNSANDNTISRNKQTNNQTNQDETNGETRSENKVYQLDMLVQGNGLMEEILNQFDVKCFNQFW